MGFLCNKTRSARQTPPTSSPTYLLPQHHPPPIHLFFIFTSTMAGRGGSVPRTPMPSTADKDNKEDMRDVIAAASVALGASRDADANGAPGASFEVPLAIDTQEQSFPGYMAYDSMHHHATVAYGHAQAQLAADRPPSPEPSTLPYPSFLTQSATPVSRGSAPAATPQSAAVGSHAQLLEMPAVGGTPQAGSLPFAAALASTKTDAHGSGSSRAGRLPAETKGPKGPARAPSSRAGSKRPIINPGSGTQTFTPERARAAAAKRWSAAAARRRGRGVPSLASLSGAAAPSAVGGASMAAGTSAGETSAAGCSSMVGGLSTAGGLARGREAAATAGLIALSSASPGRATSACAPITKTAAATSPAAAMQMAEDLASALSKKTAALAATKAVSSARTTAVTKASTVVRAAKVARGEKTAGGAAKTVLGSKTVPGSIEIGGSAADAIVGLAADVAQLRREVAELRRLKDTVMNLIASVSMNAEQLGTHGHSIEVLAAGFAELKRQVGTTCKPGPVRSPGSDLEEDDDEEPPARKAKRVRFSATTTTFPSSQAMSMPSVPAQSPPPPAPADNNVPCTLPSSAGEAPPSTSAELPPLPLLAAGDGVPPLEDLAPVGSARLNSWASELRATTPSPRSRLRRPTPRVCDAVTRVEAQATRRAEGTIIMQCIPDLLNPRVTKLIALATVSRDVYLDPETKFEMIVANAMEYMGVSADEANVFLLEMIDQPTKKRVRDGAKPKTVRACAPLGMVFSHAMWAIKAVVVAAWFDAVGSSPSTMSVTTAAQWKLNRRYGQSDGGRVGVIAASKQMFMHLNARHRIKEPTESGQVVVVHETAGHYGLACTFVAEALDAVVTGVKVGGPDGDRFKRYVAEMVSLDMYLPKDNTVHHGLVIVDGADPNRAKFPEEYMPAPDDDANNPAGVPVVAPVFMA